MNRVIEHRVLRLWINKRGKVKRQLLPGKVPADENLLHYMPSEAVCDGFAQRGYTFCNCHLIEVDAPATSSRPECLVTSLFR